MTYEEHLKAIFKRDDIRGVVGTELTDELVAEAACAFARRFKASATSSPLRVAIGYDARLSSPELALAAAKGVVDGGCLPVLLGMCSSEQLYYVCGVSGDEADAIQKWDCAGGIMVTASHNPAEYNGMKFVLAGGKPLDADGMTSLRETMAAIHAERLRQVALADEFASEMLRRSGWNDAAQAACCGRKLRIVVNAGNGVGWRAFAPCAARLERFGMEFVPFEGEPDGHFPNGVPNPLLPEFMGRLARQVKEQGADLGIAFDGDADRAGFVDEGGQVLAPAEVYTAVAGFKLANLPSGAPRPVIMRNLCCSQYILEAFRDRAVDVIDTPVGHGQIKRLMRSEEFKERVLFAGEHSGHYFYPEFFSVDSGIMTALTLLHCLQEDAANGRRLSQRFALVRRNYCWSGELNAQLATREAVMAVMAQTWLRTAERFGASAVRMEVFLDETTGLNRIRKAVATAEYAPAAMAFPDLKVCLDDGAGNGWW